MVTPVMPVAPVVSLTAVVMHVLVVKGGLVVVAVVRMERGLVPCISK